MPEYKQGEVYLIAEGNPQGHEIKKTRPWVIVSQTQSNQERGTVVAVPLSKSANPCMALHIGVTLDHVNSCAVVEQIKAIDKSRIIHFKGVLPIEDMLRILFGLSEVFDLKCVVDAKASIVADQRRSVEKTSAENATIKADLIGHHFFSSEEVSNRFEKNILPDYRRGAHQLTLMMRQEIFALAALSNDLLVVGSDRIEIIGMPSGTPVKTFYLEDMDRDDSQITMLEALKDGTFLSGHSCGRIRHWDITKNVHLCEFQEETFSSIVKIVQLSSTVVASCSYYALGYVILWDLEQRSMIKKIKVPFGVNSIAAMGDGLLLSCYRRTPVLKIWDIGLEEFVGEFSLHYTGESGTVCHEQPSDLLLFSDELLFIRSDSGFSLWNIYNYSSVPPRCFKRFPKDFFKTSNLRLYPSFAVLPCLHFAGHTYDGRLSIFEINKEESSVRCINVLALPFDAQYDSGSNSIAACPNGDLVTCTNIGKYSFWRFPEKTEEPVTAAVPLVEEAAALAPVEEAADTWCRLM